MSSTYIVLNRSPDIGRNYKRIKTGIYVSRDLIKQAGKHKCRTIVMGRRPRAAEKGIFGGVSDQTLQQTQNLALWLVG